MRRIAVFLVASLLATLALAATPGSAQTPTQGGIVVGPVEYVTYLPFDNSTSTGVSIQGKYMYLTSWKQISIYDISDPEAPVQTATLPVGFMFENEDVEITPDASYLFFSESLPNDEFHVFDIEDKTNIQPVTTLAGAGDHTFSCILKCKWGYGSDGTIIDLRDPTNPKLAAQRDSDQNWHAQTGLQGGGHDVTEVKDGFIITSPLADPLQYIDVRDPMNPKVLARGAKPDTAAYLFHSGEWPNGGNDRWLLMQGEDNANPRCDPEANGPFMVYDTAGWQKTKTFKISDIYAVQNGTYTDGNPPANGLGCSAHWFESHPTFDNGGIVAMGYYEHGTRFFNVTSKGKIQEVGVFLPFGGSTSAAYWASRDPKNRIVYAVDYTRGIDVLRYTGELGGGGGGGGGGGAAKRPRVKMAAKPYRPERGSKMNFVVRLAACERDNLNPAGTKVNLQQKKSGTWKTIASKEFDRGCREVFPKRANFRSATFRATWPKQKPGYTSGRSQEITVNTRG